LFGWGGGWVLFFLGGVGGGGGGGGGGVFFPSLLLLSFGSPNARSFVQFLVRRFFPRAMGTPCFNFPPTLPPLIVVLAPWICL